MEKNAPLALFFGSIKDEFARGQPHPGDDEGSVRAGIWA
jgi:hypothetical protein